MVSREELQRLSDECDKVAAKIKQSDAKLQVLDQDIKQGGSVNKALMRKMKAEEKNETEAEADSEYGDEDAAKRLKERLRLKFYVEPLEERDVCKQLEEEIEEFCRWVLSQAKQLKPVRQKLVEELSQIVRQLDPDLDAIFIS